VGSVASRIWLAGFLAACSYAICRMPLLPLLARDLGADAPALGLIVGASTITGIVLKLPAGAWSDVAGRRPFLIAGGLVFAVMPFAYLGVATLGGLLVLRFAHGSATAIFNPVVSASISDVAPPARRATWLSVTATLQGMAQAIAPLVAGWLIAQGDYDAAFIVAGVIALAVPAIAATWPAAPPPASALRATARQAAQPPDRWLQFRSGIGGVARDRVILATSLAQAALLAVSGALTAFLPLYAMEVRGLDVVETGALFSLHAITGIIMRPIAGTASDRVGRRPLIAGGLLLCGVTLALVPAASSGRALAAVAIASAGAVAMTSAATSALITDRSRQSQYGAAHGVFGTVYDIGDAMGPIAAGVLVGMFGFSYMFAAAAAVAILTALGLSLFWSSAETAPR
jgi:DHA1 family multidrug resistance protein-like MFS transporter